MALSLWWERLSGLAAAALAVGLTLACDDEPAPPGPACVPGLAQSCNGPGRCEGAQACLEDGTGFGPCQCVSTADAGGSSATTVCSRGELRICLGAETCGGVQQCGDDGTFGACDCSSRLLANNVLGAACASDAECGPELVCWQSSAQSFGPFLGGAAHGYCTRRCVVLEDCSAFDPFARCSDPGAAGGGVCLRGCASKDPAPNEGKCLNRIDQMCLSVGAAGVVPFDPVQRQPGGCLPNCGSDQDCDAGRRCDLGTGLCRDAVAPGLPLGAACSLDADCQGTLCLGLPATGDNVCSAPCALFSLGCGYALDANPRGAACIAPWPGGNEGQQDLGLCIELCNQASDCEQPGFVCDTSQPVPAGSVGACLPPGAVSEPGPDAGDAG